MFSPNQEDKYQFIKRSSIKTTYDLMTFIKDMKPYDKLVTYGYVNADKKEAAKDGFSVNIGNYRMEKQEFTDPFDFPDGFYTTTIYINDGENGKPCLELISSAFEKYDTQKRLFNISELKNLLSELKENNRTLIPVLSRDDNFELKGSVTNDTYLEIYKEIETDTNYLVLEII